MGRTYRVSTLGCKANLFDSQRIETELQKRGWTAAGADVAADVCVVNSCTVTDEADRQSRKMAARLFRENPRARVVLTGCGAEIEPERLRNSPGIHYVIGNRDKQQLAQKIEELFTSENRVEIKDDGGVWIGTTEFRSRHDEKLIWPEVDSPTAEDFALVGGAASSTTRAFIKVQEGCNHFCTYCIIPYARGPARSLTIDEVIAQVRAIEAQGYPEVVLTGTNLGDYGTDLGIAEAGDGSGFAQLVAAILRETSIPQLRLSSLDPVELRPEIFELLATERRLAPHIHLSAQAFQDRILRRMKRKYGVRELSEALRKLGEIVNPDGYRIFVGMDLITGFPGEGESEFLESMENLRSHPWGRLHVFPYSERMGTPATRLDAPVRREVRVERSRILGQLSVERYTEWAREEMQRLPIWPRVLLEKGSHNHKRVGYSPNYLRVGIEGESSAGFHSGFCPRSIEVLKQSQDVLISGNFADVSDTTQFTTY